jgi:hypothetical protein
VNRNFTSTKLHTLILGVSRGRIPPNRALLTSYLFPGRPQRDGPALRSTTLIKYANWLLANGNTSYVTSTLWPVIKLDLDYVSSNWNQSTFDLWEEIDSSSFFTTAVQHRALREGSALATAIGETSVVSGYTAQASNLFCFQQVRAVSLFLRLVYCDLPSSLVLLEPN